MKRIIACSGICLILILSAVAQDSTKLFDNPVVGVYYMQGQVSQQKVPQLPKFNVSRYIDVNMLWQTTGSKHWHQNYCFPEMGIGFTYGDLGSDSIMGQIIALYPTWIIKSFKNRKFGVDYKLGIGFAYFNNPYDRLVNLENEIVGSVITNFTKLGLGLRYSPISKLSLYAGIDFIHCSNGHTYIPNFGLNDMTISLGARYALHNAPLIKHDQSRETYKLRYNFRIAYGVHELAGSRFPVGGPKYPVYNVTPFISKRLSKINDIHLGFGVTYYVSYYDYLRVNDLFEGHESEKSIVLNAMVGHEFLISHFSLITEINVNFYNPFYKELYQQQDVENKGGVDIKQYLGTRIGFLYYPFQTGFSYKHNVGVGLFLKTNLGQADYVECNLTYRL